MILRRLGILLIVLGSAAAAPARSEALLLPTLSLVPNTLATLRCDGLSVMDVATARTQRHYPDFGCVDAVAGAGATRAVAILRVDSDARTPDRLDYLDLVHGRILDELVLPLSLASGTRFLRMLDDSRALLMVEPANGGTRPTRLVRADLVDGRWQWVADLTVDGRVSVVGSGDTLAQWRVQPGGLHVDLRRADDLSLTRSLDLSDASTAAVGLVFASRDRIHVVRGPSNFELTLRSYDRTSGLLQREVPWPHDLVRFVDLDAAGRLRLIQVRPAAPPSYSYRMQTIAVDLDTDAITVLAEGPYVGYPAGIAHLGEQSVVFHGIDYLCFNICFPTTTSPYSFKAGGTLLPREPAIITSPPNSMQFLVPSFIAGGTAAEVPALDVRAGMALAGLLLLAAIVHAAQRSPAG